MVFPEVNGKSRLRARWLLTAVAVYALWLAALSSATVSVTDRDYKTWDLRLRQVWRMASAGITRQAPEAYPLYIGALLCLTIAVPISVWAVARARDDIALQPDALPLSRVSTESALRVEGISPHAWTALVAAIAVTAVFVMTPGVRSVTFAHSRGLVEIPNGFRPGAHGWHISRAESVSRDTGWSALSPWVAHHQGGYPAESAPLGLTWLTLMVATLSFGQLPIAYAHTLVAIAVFLLPAFALIWLARRDGWPVAVGGLAATLHLVIPGGDSSGGYRTIVSAGHVENAAAAACVLLFIPLFARSVITRSRRSLAAVALCAAAAMSMSTSAAVLILAAAGTIGASYPRRASRIIGVVALLSSFFWLPLLLSAALYASPPPAYESAGAFVFELLGTVTPPLFVFAVVGAAVRRSGMDRLPIVALTLIVLVLCAASALGAGIPYVHIAPLIAFERLLMLYLAAVGLHAAVRAIAQTLDVSPRLAGAAQLGGAVAFAFAFAGPWETLPAEAKGLSTPSWSADIKVADLAGALEAGARGAPPATAVLLVGGNNKAPMLWAPIIQHGLFFYSDPVWHWRKAASPSFEMAWDPGIGTAVPELLSSTALRARGIRVVIAERELWRKAVSTPSSLERVYAGTYFDAFTVANPSRVVDWTGRVTTINVAAEEISARGFVTGNEVQVRRNWHPRWRAVVNGRAASVEETGDGFMRIPVERGALELQLRYVPVKGTVLPVAAAAGALIVAAWLRRRRPTPR
jgi:hypothetical protein